jgi:hypothetical protein
VNETRKSTCVTPKLKSLQRGEDVREGKEARNRPPNISGGPYKQSLTILLEKVGDLFIIIV